MGWADINENLYSPRPPASDWAKTAVCSIWPPLIVQGAHYEYLLHTRYGPCKPGMAVHTSTLPSPP
jgi:hypothetical protein